MFELYQNEMTKSIKDKLIKGKNGHVVQNYKNYLTVFERDSNLKRLFKRDMRTGIIHLDRDTFWKDENKGSIFDKTEMSHILIYLELAYSLKIKEMAENVINVVADQNNFHPIRDYLDNLKWDGRERLGNLFIDYLGSENNEFNKLVTKQAFVAGVARIFEPGYKHDTVIVLTGRQGIGKSYLLKKMGKGWFNDSLDSFKGDEAYMKIANSWIIELSELSALSGTGVERIKQFISATHDTYRPKYGRHAEQNLRECIFFGTTNDDEFLMDSTGNRRFIPMKVGINESTKGIDSLTEQTVDQLWAEAKVLYEEGFITYLDDTEVKEELSIRHKEHQVHDELEYEIARFCLMKFPRTWEMKTSIEKRAYYQDYDERDANNPHNVPKEKVSAREIRDVILNDNSVQGRKESKEINQRLKKIFNIHKLEKIEYKKFYPQQRGIRITSNMLEDIKEKYNA